MKAPRFNSRPEALLQAKIVTLLEAKGWLVEVTQGNAFQKGLPDLYLFHPHFGHKWVDVKLWQGSVLTKAQCQKWPRWEKYGVKIHIMRDCTEDEYQKIFGDANWREMWKPRYDEYLLEIEEILESEDWNEDE